MHELVLYTVFLQRFEPEIRLLLNGRHEVAAIFNFAIFGRTAAKGTCKQFKSGRLVGSYIGLWFGQGGFIQNGRLSDFFWVERRWFCWPASRFLFD